MQTDTHARTRTHTHTHTHRRTRLRLRQQQQHTQRLGHLQSDGKRKHNARDHRWNPHDQLLTVHGGSGKCFPTGEKDRENSRVRRMCRLIAHMRVSARACVHTSASHAQSCSRGRAPASRTLVPRGRSPTCLPLLQLTCTLKQQTQVAGSHGPYVHRHCLPLPLRWTRLPAGAPARRLRGRAPVPVAELIQKLIFFIIVWGGK